MNKWPSQVMSMNAPTPFDLEYYRQYAHSTVLTCCDIYIHTHAHAHAHMALAHVGTHIHVREQFKQFYSKPLVIFQEFDQSK